MKIKLHENIKSKNKKTSPTNRTGECDEKEISTLLFY